MCSLRTQPRLVIAGEFLECATTNVQLSIGLRRSRPPDRHLLRTGGMVHTEWRNGRADDPARHTERCVQTRLVDGVGWLVLLAALVRTATPHT
jgi:hypothetical protein